MKPCETCKTTKKRLVKKTLKKLPLRDHGRKG